MNIVLNRVDERLIHGQVLASWARKLQVRQILVVDDQLADDPFTETVLTMSLPSDIDLKIMDVTRGGDYIAANQNGSGPNTILLMKSPAVAGRLWDLGYHPKSINIGGMSAGPARRHLCRSVYASEEEINLFRMFQRNGTEVYIQVVFAESRIRVSDLL